MAWQTMDTAPKDGTRIVLSDGQIVAIGRSSPQLGEGWTMEIERVADFQQGITGYWEIAPVQWQPLPIPEPQYIGSREANPHSPNYVKTTKTTPPSD